MKKSIIVLLIFFNISKSYTQNDTIYLSDTIISSIKIINKDENNLNYFHLDSNKKVFSSVSLDNVKAIVFENDKIEVFCDLISRKKFLGTDERISINYGKRDSLWLDNNMYTLMSNDLKNFNFIIDALNYMGNEGWKVINSYSSSENSYTVEHYILQKEIKKEIKKNKL